MQMTACPGCGLPRTDETAAAEPCPICDHPSHLPLAEEHDDEPEHDQPWIIDESMPAAPVLLAMDSHAAGHRSTPPAARSEPRNRVRNGFVILGTALGFVLGAATGAAGVLVLQAVVNGRPDFSRFAWNNSASAKSTGSDDADLTPRPREVATRPPSPLPPAPTPTPAPQPPPASKTDEPVLVGPQPRPAPPNPFRPQTPRAERLDNPQVYAPFIPPGGQLIARGRVKRLIVSGLEREAVLDCSDLEAQEVVVVGKIDGGSRLSLFAPGGKVRFLSRVDGRSQVEVRAPGGSIAFETPTERGQEGSRISGGSSVELIGRTILFRGHITGDGTAVSIKIDPRGSLEFERLDNRARLEYAKASAEEGTPKIKKGKVEGKAVFRSLD